MNDSLLLEDVSEDSESMALVEQQAMPVAVAARVTKSEINISADVVQECTAHLDEPQRKAVRKLHAICKAVNHWSWAEAEKETSISTTVLSRIWSDKYRWPAEIKETFCPECKTIVKATRSGRCPDCNSGTEARRRPHPKANDRVPLESMMPRIERFIRHYEERSLVPVVPVLQTSVVRAIYKICREAYLSNTVAFIYGDNQTGKSKGAEYYYTQHNDGETKLIRIPIGGGLQMLCKEIAKAFGVSPNSCFELLRTRVLNAVSRENLVVFDEINLLFDTYQASSVKKCFEFIREIHDRCGCGMVLIGDNDFRKRLYGEGGYVEEARMVRKLRNRGDLELQINTQASQKDIELIADFYGLKPPTGKASEYIEVIAKESGLGKYCKFLARAARRASKSNEKMKWHHFEATYSLALKMKAGMKDDDENAERGARNAE